MRNRRLAPLRSLRECLISHHSGSGGWFDAFSRENIDEYLSYYDRATFRFNGGGFKQWEEQSRRLFTNDQTDHVELENIHLTGNDGSSVEAYVDYVLVASGDTVAGRMAALWKKSSDGWHIVRQKRLVRQSDQE